MAFRFCLAIVTVSVLSGAVASPESAGATVHYRLPVTGPLPKTYRVTLAATDPQNPDWIVSTFVEGAVRTVTTENQGNFTEAWNGLDENLMPVPPGSYGLKGIYMPAEKWDIDGQYHTLTAQYVSAADSWAAPKSGDSLPPVVTGDPIGRPLSDIAIAPNGLANFLFLYLENARNNYVTDLKKPIGYNQVLSSSPSGGTAGGSVTTIDEKGTVWSYAVFGGPTFIYRADGKHFGTDGSLYLKGVTHPAGWVTGLASWAAPGSAKTFVYAAERGAFDVIKGNEVESTSRFVNKIVQYDGDSGAVLSELGVERPQDIGISGNQLFVLHAASSGGYSVSAVTISDGRLQGQWRVALTVPSDVTPICMAVDSHQNIYLSDSAANKVYMFGPDGRRQLIYGRLSAQIPGSYDPMSLIAPERLASWKDQNGRDRLIIVEMGGSNRVTEWSDQRALLREWLPAQTMANFGYAVDPRHPELIYMLGQGGWLVRYRVDYTSGAWAVDAVWPNVPVAPLDVRAEYPKVIYHGQTQYLAFARNYSIYRLQGKDWLPSAALINVKQSDGKVHYFIWHDSNGDGKIEPEEYLSNPTQPPAGALRYWGETWLDDLSLVAIQENSADIWRLPVKEFDQSGNPVYDPNGWTKLLTDPVFSGKQQSKVDAIHGANEIATNFNSPWGKIDGSMEQGFYVDARGGPDISANYGAQQKLSRYVPDGAGNFKLKWRVGRTALNGVAQPGEIYGSINLDKPINGLVGITDNSRSGYLVYTDEGLYVDTLFGDSRAQTADKLGMYASPGEFFAGHSYYNPGNGKVYIAFGKSEPILYEVPNWSGNSTLVHRIDQLDKSVNLSPADIAPPSDAAMRFRNKLAASSFASSAAVATPQKQASFFPVRNGAPKLDGSTSGWETAAPMTFNSGASQSVEVRCMYDTGHLFLRWHVRLGRAFEARNLSPPERMFTHDREADTLSFYIQGAPNASPTGSKDGSPGDARLVFGLFSDQGSVKPVVLGMYPSWPTQGNSQTYHTPTSSVTFQNVALLNPTGIFGSVDPDGQGFVIAAEIPREAIPNSPNLAAGFNTRVDFEATLGGHDKFWWANTDGSASIETYDEPTESRLYPGAWAAAQFH